MIDYLKNLFKIMWELFPLFCVIFLFLFLIMALMKLALFAPVKPTDILYILLFCAAVTLVLLIIFILLLKNINDEFDRKNKNENYY